MANKDEIKTLDSGRFVVGSSGGFYLAFQTNKTALVNNVQIKYFSGGSLEICGTTTQAGFAGASAPGYLMGTSEVQSFGGGLEFYLRATGATVVGYYMYGKTMDQSNP